MSGLPRNGDWQTKDVEGELSVYRHADFRNLITITGPDREANARLFLRAQHMGELVGAANSLVKQISRHADIEVDLENEGDALETLSAILAKIGGGE